jgi:L-lysine cyclodeaminase
MLYLGPHDITRVVNSIGLHHFIDGLMVRMRDAMVSIQPGVLQTPSRSGFQYVKPTTGLIEWMPAHEVGRVVGVKMVSYHPSNPGERRTPTVSASTLLFDTLGGRQTAMVDSTLLTALRTGAASAIATDVFARPGSIRLGIIGCGAQAVAQAHAISRVRHVYDLVSFDTDAAVADTLARRLGKVDLPVRTVDSSEARLIRETCDVICTVTSVDPGCPPVISDGPHLPWLHVNAIGSDFPGKVELPRTLLQRALVVTDHEEQCRIEGESQQLEVGEYGPKLSDVLLDSSKWSAYRESLTVFDSTGYSLFDLVAAEYAVGLALHYGLGVELDHDVAEDDPYDPYALLQREAFR